MRLSLAAAQLSVGVKSAVKCFDALSSCQFFFFHHHFCVWLQLSFIFPEGLSLLCHATRFSTVCVVDNSNVDLGTCGGKRSHQRIQKEKVLKFSCKSKLQCVWGGGAWKLPGWLASKWCSSVYWLLLLARILFLFNVCILYLYWMQDILLWKSQMQTGTND